MKTSNLRKLLDKLREINYKTFALPKQNYFTNTR